MTEPALDPRPGAVLGDGRYRLDELIGSGGMATVWRATDRRLRRHVAIKLISEALADDPTYAVRFAREARTAAGLSHANLVGVFDFGGADDGQPFLVMEYVDGGTLAERLGRGPVVGEEARAVAGDLLAALACIHSAGILHRDIKPANVLLSSDGRARITDFGIAHPEDSTRLTETGHLVGTLRYLAPEVIDGQPASQRSDLYALGVLLRDLSGPDGDDPTTEELVTRLTDRTPAGRPASAEQAQLLLDPPRAPVERKQPRPPETQRVPPPAPDPRGPAPARRRDRRPAAARVPGRAMALGRAAATARLGGRVGRPGPAPRRRGHGGALARGARARVVRMVGIAAAGVALVVAVVVLVGGGGGGGSPPASKPAAHAVSGKPGLGGRLDELARLVRAAGQP